MEKGVNRRIINKKIIAVLLAIIFAISVTPQVTYATSTQDKLNQAKEDRKKTQDELEGKKDQKEDLEDKKTELQGALETLDSELTQVSNNLEQLEQDIAEKEAEIEQTGLELEEAIRIKDEQYEAMKLRIQFMYESRDFVLLETLFASSNFSEFLNRNEYIEQLAAYDDRKLEEFKEIEQTVAEKEAALIVEKEELDELLVKVQAEQARVAGLVSQTRGTISNYKNQILLTEQEILANEQRIKEQNDNIEQLQKQLEEERRLSQLAAQSVWRNISDVSFADGDRYLLANLIYCEAGNQPYSGQVAVGAVVINRVLSPVFPDTVVGVIYQNRQFSPVASGRLALALAEDRATVACYKAADEAMQGATTVGNCLFFRTPIEGLTGISIGGHIFY